ncbi:unnamed protein product [Allacma fusca]|uniref:Uncharacterized protein n=1 Tax=Allacma fusca TaxID=39272 RepID=A0A8J2KFS8_9HEXA|nr:unnamed protein product [Allacma fusca]
MNGTSGTISEDRSSSPMKSKPTKLHKTVFRPSSSEISLQDEDNMSRNSEKNSLKSEIVLLKPGKRSSPAFRIQVTVHRPLSWQLSSSSSSSIHIPRKHVRRSGSSPGRNEPYTSKGKNNGEQIDEGDDGENKRISMSSSASLVVRKGRRSTPASLGNRNSDFSSVSTNASNGNSSNNTEKNRLHRRRNQRVKRIQMNSSAANSITSSSDDSKSLLSFSYPHSVTLILMLLIPSHASGESDDISKKYFSHLAFATHIHYRQTYLPTVFLYLTNGE